MTQLEVQVVPGMQAIAREDWAGLDAGGSPFLDWEFLSAIEAASAVPEEGMAPAHLLARQGERLVGACPLYIKGDGRAEFIYDWNWHALAARMGLEYYPKAVAMCPVTPVVAPRFLVAPELEAAPIRKALALAAEKWARAAGLTGLHWLFTNEDDTRLLESLGGFRRESVQLRLDCSRWRDFDDYLSCFRARHRKSIKRERRRIVELGLETELLEGEAIGAEHRDALFEFYSRTCWEHGTGSDYVKRESWDRLFAQWRHRLLLCFARDRDGELVGGSLSVQGDECLYGRYWGCRGDWPGLYFELTCYAPLEAAIERGLEKFWAGFGNAEHKLARGFEPERILSVHRVFDPQLAELLQRWVGRERELVSRDLEEAHRASRLVR